MHGGEVRIEIIQQNRTMAREADPEEGDGSTKYYEYYTRSNPSMPEQDENEYGDEDIMEPVVPTQMLTPSPRPGTNVSMDTESSHERKFVEDSMAEEFGGLNFEVSDLPTAVVPARANSDTSSRPVMDSRKPSSSVLSFDQNSRSQSSLARKSTGGSRRPVLGRDLSSSSYIINGRKISGNGGGLNPSEEVSQELRRLSKISAGSGVSGLAIVFTADGPASTHSSDDDDEDSFEGHRWTREEKGKARAASSEPSATHDQRSHTRTLSEHSEHAAETDTHQTDDNHDDSKSLLPVVPKIIQHKKLQAQKPNKEVLVHQGDPKYEL